MRILYICPGHYKSSDGIFQKVKMKTDFWKAQGLEVTILTYDDVVIGRLEKLLLKIRVQFFRSFFFSYFFASKVNKEIRRLKPDLIYTRHFLWPNLVSSIKIKLVLEVNGDIKAENRTAPLWLRYLINRSIKYYRKHASAVVTVGANFGHEFDSIKRRVIIPNCILATSDEVLSNFNSRALKFLNTTPQNVICFMATKNRPHNAIDFIVDFVSRLKTPHELWIIGAIKKTSVKLPSNSKVKFLGTVEDGDLKEILWSAKVAIGWLNFNKGATASPLKVRTYIQFGLPVFGLENDCDFDNSLPFFRGLDPASNLTPEYCAVELDRFLDSEAVRTPRQMKTLPIKVSDACLNNREQVVIDLFKSL